MWLVHDLLQFAGWHTYGFHILLFWLEPEILLKNHEESVFFPALVQHEGYGNILR
jgi:hypothetical protein